MRMWMVDPAIMCQRHLLGEHAELHMFVGHLARGRHVRGYVENNCFELESLYKRHEALAREMHNRKYTHASPLQFTAQNTVHLTEFETMSKVNRSASLAELTGRCPKCFARWQERR